MFVKNRCGYAFLKINRAAYWWQKSQEIFFFRGKGLPDSRVDLRLKSLVAGVEIRVEEVDGEARKIHEVRADSHHWLNDA